jgi:hypothetical protein
MLDFPNNPALLETYESGDLTWQWDGVKWIMTTVQGGPQGPVGPVGPVGPMGPQGPPGGGSYGTTGEYTWDSSTAPPTVKPAKGYTVSGDNADQTLITTLYICKTTSDGVDASTILSLIKPRDMLFIQDFDAAANARVYECSDVTSEAGEFVYVPVTYRSSGGAALADSNQVLLNLLLGGAAGGSSVTVSDAPPANPQPGDLWWASISGQLFVWFADQDTAQWVATSSAGGSIGDAPLDGVMYGRKSAVWSPISDEFLPRAGGALTGGISITTEGWGQLALHTPAGQGNQIIGYVNAEVRWAINLGDGTAESGGNAGSTFSLQRFDDGGTYIDSVITADRASGSVGITTLTAGDITTNTFYSGGMVNAADGFNGSGAVTVYPNAGNIVQAGGGSFMVQTKGGEAFMTFHIPGQFATNFGMATNGNFYIGGWSLGMTSFQIWTSRDFANPACDYRIKTNVAPLPSMWDKVKALRPIRYQQKESSYPSAPKGAKPVIERDDAERWGFVAHELQETLVERAATGVKDDKDILQSPNLMLVAAALTKALQEAMARIETLAMKNDELTERIIALEAARA